MTQNPKLNIWNTKPAGLVFSWTPDSNDANILITNISTDTADVIA